MVTLTCDSFPISTETNVYTKQTVSISLLQSVRGNITYSTLMWSNLSELFDFDNNRFICYNGTCRNDQEFNIHVDVSQKKIVHLESVQLPDTHELSLSSGWSLYYLY